MSRLPFPILRHAPAVLAAGLAILMLAQAGCGYRLAASSQDAPFVLGEKYRALWIKSVENPTVETWLGPTLRSLLRDEITNRGQARWTGKADADAWVEITVHSFTTQTDVTGGEEESLRYSSDIALTVVVKDAHTGGTVWTSGQVGAAETFYGQDAQDARLQAVTLAVRRVVDRMSQQY